MSDGAFVTYAADRLGGVHALAVSHSWVNPAGSLIAMSESTLRSSSMPAFFIPLMNTE